jgi:hypothetical protein
MLSSGIVCLFTASMVAHGLSLMAARLSQLAERINVEASA